VLIILEWIRARGMVVIKVFRPYNPVALLFIVLENKGEQAAASLDFSLVPFAVYFFELLAIFRYLLVVHAFEILADHLSLLRFR
jgi:hypothetical protein